MSTCHSDYLSLSEEKVYLYYIISMSKNKHLNCFPYPAKWEIKGDSNTLKTVHPPNKPEPGCKL